MRQRSMPALPAVLIALLGLALFACTAHAGEYTFIPCADPDTGLYTGTSDASGNFSVVTSSLAGVAYEPGNASIWGKQSPDYATNCGPAGTHVVDHFGVDTPQDPSINADGIYFGPNTRVFSGLGGFGRQQNGTVTGSFELGSTALKFKQVELYGTALTSLIAPEYAGRNEKGGAFVWVTTQDPLAPQGIYKIPCFYDSTPSPAPLCQASGTYPRFGVQSAEHPFSSGNRIQFDDASAGSVDRRKLNLQLLFASGTTPADPAGYSGWMLPNPGKRGVNGFFEIYGGRIRVADSSPPILSAVGTRSDTPLGGSLLPANLSAPGASPRDGRQGLNVKAQDPSGSGIYLADLLVDDNDTPAASEVFNSNDGKCSDLDSSDGDRFEFAASIPCLSGTDKSVSFDLDTREVFTDGQHKIRVRVSDASGNTVLSPEHTVVIENDFSLAYEPERVTFKADRIASIAVRTKKTSPARFSVDPPLPAGLSLDPTGGQITGVPHEAALRHDYTVTMARDVATGTPRTATAVISIAVEGEKVEDLVTRTPPPSLLPELEPTLLELELAGKSTFKAVPIFVRSKSGAVVQLKATLLGARGSAKAFAQKMLTMVDDGSQLVTLRPSKASAKALKKLRSPRVKVEARITEGTSSSQSGITQRVNSLTARLRKR